MNTKPSRIDDKLRTLPDIEPPPGSWQRVLSRYHAEQSSARSRWTGGLAQFAAAAAVAAIAVLLVVNRTAQPVVSDEPAVIAEVVPAAPSAAELDRLRRQSQHMERMLLGLPQRPAVVRADTASLMSELEDRIAAVDYRLNYARAAPADAPQLWQERVQLMDQLVRARYAEAGADAF
jgi:hypothetical protein